MFRFIQNDFKITFLYVCTFVRVYRWWDTYLRALTEDEQRKSNCCLKIVTPTDMMVLVALCMEGFIDISEVTSGNGDVCVTFKTLQQFSNICIRECPKVFKCWYNTVHITCYVISLTQNVAAVITASSLLGSRRASARGAVLSPLSHGLASLFLHQQPVSFWIMSS